MSKIKILTLSLCFSLIVANLPAVNNTQYNTFKNNRKSIVSAKSFEKKDILNTNENDSSNNNQQNTTKIDTNLDNTKISWWYKPNKDHTTPEINTKLKFDLNKYDALYVGNTDEKVIYLTFDEGYENGYTAKILDILKDNDVKAIFFVTSPYIRDNPDLIKRMVDEGHIVGNHSNTHPSMPTVTGDETKFNNEFKDVEDKFKEVTGEDMPKFLDLLWGNTQKKA